MSLIVSPVEEARSFSDSLGVGALSDITIVGQVGPEQERKQLDPGGNAWIFDDATPFVEGHWDECLQLFLQSLLVLGTSRPVPVLPPESVLGFLDLLLDLVDPRGRVELTFTQGLQQSASPVNSPLARVPF